MENKSKKIFSRNQNIYKIKVDGITVEMEYSKNKKYFEECILNIIKEKVKTDIV